MNFTTLPTKEIAWIGTPESRILSIRKFRKYINNIPFYDAVKETANNWGHGPKINKLYFNLSNVEDWPSPWDLFGQSSFCANSQILGTFYTLILSEHAKDHDIKLVITQDVIDGEKAVLVLDNAPVSNVEVSAVISKNDIKNKLGV